MAFEDLVKVKDRFGTERAVPGLEQEDIDSINNEVVIVGEKKDTVTEGKEDITAGAAPVDRERSDRTVRGGIGDNQS